VQKIGAKESDMQPEEGGYTVRTGNDMQPEQEIIFRRRRRGYTVRTSNYVATITRK
jgi:hypothetical protein